jgi:hypothetical protein
MKIQSTTDVNNQSIHSKKQILNKLMQNYEKTLEMKSSPEYAKNTLLTEHSNIDMININNKEKENLHKITIVHKKTSSVHNIIKDVNVKKKESNDLFNIAIQKENKDNKKIKNNKDKKAKTGCLLFKCFMA